VSAFARIIAATPHVGGHQTRESGFARCGAEPAPWLLHDLPAPADFAAAGNPAPSPTDDRTAAIQRALEEGYARGHADGVAAGQNEVRHSFAGPLRALAAAIAQIEAGQARVAAIADERIASLSLAIARHLVEREVQVDPTVLHRLVRRAIEEFPADQHLTVRVNPDDLARLQAVAGGTFVSAREFAWVADARVGCGGCVLESADRIVDSRVETAIERIYRHLVPAAR
jgi:flagellar biosynthesis/type III secretory pathway protein FliH